MHVCDLINFVIFFIVVNSIFCFLARVVKRVLYLNIKYYMGYFVITEESRSLVLDLYDIKLVNGEDFEVENTTSFL